MIKRFSQYHQHNYLLHFHLVNWNSQLYTMTSGTIGIIQPSMFEPETDSEEGQKRIILLYLYIRVAMHFNALSHK